jgi:DNA-binding LytR/AlgR family response regulator
METLTQNKKTRIIVRKGAECIALCVKNISLIYTKEKSLILVDHLAQEYVLNGTLSELQADLDQRLFFRANRQQIININFIKGFRACENVRLLVELTVPNLHVNIIISQETAPLFKKWLCES